MINRSFCLSAAVGKGKRKVLLSMTMSSTCYWPVLPCTYQSAKAGVIYTGVAFNIPTFELPYSKPRELNNK